MASQSKAVKKSGKKRPAYHRILLKLSGESFQGQQGFGIDGQTIYAIANELRDVHKLGTQIAIMVGGGNIFRGARQKGFEIDRATGDYMGMLATVLNALACRTLLKSSACTPACRAPSKCTRSANPSSAAALSAISKKGAS